MGKCQSLLFISILIVYINVAHGKNSSIPDGRLTSPYEACRNEVIVSEENYKKNHEQWGEFGSKCKTNLNITPDIGITSLNPLNEGIKYLNFSQQVATKVISTLEKSRSYADCSASCFKGAKTCTPDGKIETEVINCTDRKNEINEGMKVYSRKIRMEMALSSDAPGLQNVTVHNVLELSKNNSAKFINTNLRDFEIGTPNPVGRNHLKEYEVKEAKRRVDKEIKDLEDEYKKSGVTHYYEWMTMRLMNRFEEHQARYRQLIYEEAPIFGVIDSPQKFNEHNDPVWTDAELASAFQKLSNNSRLTQKKVEWSKQNGKLEFERSNAEALKKWVTSFDSDRKDSNDLLFYMKMKNQVEEVLKENPGQCGVATAMEARLRSKEIQNAGAVIAASVGTSFVGKFASGTFGALRALSSAEIVSTTGLALGAGYLGDGFKQYNLQTTMAQTKSGLSNNKEGKSLASAEEIENSRENIKVALMTAPIDFPAASLIAKKLVSPVVKNTGKKELVSRPLLSEMERRSPFNATVATNNPVATIEVHELPQNMRLRKFKDDSGEELVMYEKVVTNSKNELVIQSREMTLDPLTGAFDANYPAGKLFLEDLIKEKSGKATLAFIDVNNLGYVNNNFIKGREAGDEYLKAVATAINKATKGEAQLFKLGGDEYGVMINEADPIKAQKIIQDIIDSCYSKKVHETFRNNSISKAQSIKKNRVLDANGKALPLSEEEINSIKAYSPYAREGISIGAAVVKKGDTLESLLKSAESQAVEQKIITKSELNISSVKYGGSEAVPGLAPNLKYKPNAELPTGTDQKIAMTDKIVLNPNINTIRKTGEDSIVKEKYRFGEVSVIEQKMPDGSPILKYNRFYTDTNGEKKVITRELVVNSKVGLIDGTHDSGKFVLEKLADGKNASINKRGLIWINAENLGKINYFKNGTATGDHLLELTAKTIEKEIRENGIPIKMQGSEFVILENGLTKESILGFKKRIENALNNNPEIKKIYSDQADYLKQEIKRRESLAKTAQSRQKIAELKDNLKMVSELNPQFSIESHLMKDSDDLKTALKNTRGLHYK